ncbi:MAG: NAD(P)H-hydrate dehydratase [Ferruginibacter sp.]
MKIFNAAALRAWDEFTMGELSLDRADLVNRAALACYNWLEKNLPHINHFHIWCGPGYNGADGLALALLLTSNGYKVKVIVLQASSLAEKTPEETQQQLADNGIEYTIMDNRAEFSPPREDALIIDALFGSGLNRKPEDIYARMIIYLNSLPNLRVSLDVPSGMFTDESSKENDMVKADYTLSFETYKLCLLLAENAAFTGVIIILAIGLAPSFPQETNMEIITDQEAGICYKPRPAFSHKGNFGHAKILAGSFGMMGAAVLAAKGCMAAGAGKLTCIIPKCGYDILQTVLPEAMSQVSGNKSIKETGSLENISVVAAGPGISLKKQNKTWLAPLFTLRIPLILDADGLTILSKNMDWLNKKTSQILITPHPKEFDALFGTSKNDFDRLNKAIEAAQKFHIYILLKGHYTAICTPEGKIYFNNTGNSGMAKAGMGDALTGIITGLVCSGYALPEAARLGAWLHGKAGDIAKEKYSAEAMQASDLLNCMGAAWKLLNQ